MTPPLALEWLDFWRDLVVISSGAAVFVYLFKLLQPSHEIDRIAYLALVTATVATLAGLAIGLTTLHALPLWALVSIPALAIFFTLELEFATRIMGLTSALTVVLGTLLLRPCPPMPLVGANLWPVLTATGALSAAGLLLSASGVIILFLVFRFGSALTARKTSRFFAINPTVMAELAFRQVAWAIPLQLFAFTAGVLAFSLHRLQLVPLVTLAVAPCLSLGYAIWCRRSYEPGFKPILLLVCLAAAIATLRLLSLC
ncbi:MAG TPA: hypothetical protein V6D05_14040 [Stenomitos sp.]